MPTQDTIVLERFFDEAGGMQLVIHAPFGSRINRAWGLALRKRFCRKFNFELQAAATEDNIVLSLTTAHSFALDEVAHYLHSHSVRPVLIQAMLDAPMFATRWRWVAGVALALPRFRGGKKTPPQFLRMQAEDLIAAVFPDQIACAENLVGEREIPDHPLTNQAIADCLHEAMDIDGLERLLARIEAGEIRVVCLRPDPALAACARGAVGAGPTPSSTTRRWKSGGPRRSWPGAGRIRRTPPSSAGWIPEAIERVRAEAWPDPVNAEELHDALLWLGCLTEEEARATPAWGDWLEALAGEKRVARLTAPGAALWVPAERLNAVPRAVAASPASAGDRAARRIRQARNGAGSGAGRNPARPAGRPRAGHANRLDGAARARACGGRLARLIALEAEGAILRGRFIPGVNSEQWCDRRLLARIHHYTIRRLRSEIEPVAARDFLRFLFAWQHVGG